ncbi:response regulator [Geomesophilobacter sediminis]|uniref:Response regulator n=1 Tax=Geomesophilobacter sediminis TaxID=2798584 RepID=A0A8J7M0T0_9BACT|nr:response regulator [Geomesophilobacter sediminis]MBJ6726510.1 response regulator [Geomesophilobacter sediminis]
MGKPRVLLANEARVVQELETFLKLTPVNILSASHGVQALDLIRKDRPDVVFMDLSLPLLDGPACCTLLKSDPDLSSIPVIMLLESDKRRDRERALRAGCDDVLIRPVDRELFLEKVRQFTVNVDRQDIRLCCDFPLLLLTDKSPLAARALDIGEGGIFIASDEPARVDMPLKFVFYLPTATPILFEAGGRVVWLNIGEDRAKPAFPQGFGVEFRGLDDREFAALKLFLDVAMGCFPRAR